MTKGQPQATVRCATYARYSSDQQRLASIDDQVRNCREGVVSRGWQILDQYMFSDEAVTGTARDRDGFQALLKCALVDAPPFDYVVVDDTSRLARDVVVSLDTIRELEFHGVHVYAVAQNLDSSRDDAEDFFVMHAMMDSRLLREIRYKTHRGLTGQALMGRATGGRVLGYQTQAILGDRVDAHGVPIPVGYDYVIDPDEVKIVVRIFHLFAEDGLGLHRIAIRLNAEGVPSPRAGSKHRHGGWSHTTIRAILRNERYVGHFVWNKTQWKKVPGEKKRRCVARPVSEWRTAELPHLAIIDPVLWAKTQDRIKHVKESFGERTKGRFVKPANRAAAGSRYLLSGLLRCGVCGGSMSVTGGDKNGKDGRRYACSQHASKGPAVCANSMSIKTTVADEVIATEIRERLATPQKLEEAAEIMREELAAALKEIPDQEGEVRDALAKVDNEIGNFVRAIAGGIDASSVAEALKGAEAKRDELRDELVRVQATPKPADIVLHPNAALNMIENLTEALNLDVPAAREALRHYVGSITMRPMVQNGNKTYVAEGMIDASDALGNTGNPGTWSRTAYVSVVAGPRFELGTFGL
jgi:DNA invertase Pin-like site-specific DNA recombinase